MDHGPWSARRVATPHHPPNKVASRQKLTFAREIQIAEFRLVSHDDCATFRTIDLQHGAMNEAIKKAQRLFSATPIQRQRHQSEFIGASRQALELQLFCDTKSF